MPVASSQRLPYSPDLSRLRGWVCRKSWDSQPQPVVDLFRRQQAGVEPPLVGGCGVVILLLLQGDEAAEFVDLELLEGRLVADRIGLLQFNVGLGKLAGIGQFQRGLQWLRGPWG